MLDQVKGTQLDEYVSEVPGVSAMLTVTRHLEMGDELWMFVVLRERQELDPRLDAKLRELLASTCDVSVQACRIFQLSDLPRTQRGRLMTREVECLINHRSIPNRARMRDPEIIKEITKRVASSL